MTDWSVIVKMSNAEGAADLAEAGLDWDQTTEGLLFGHDAERGAM
jgi:hypothetical protein